MTLSRSDRPYGQFPRGDAPEAATAHQTVRRVPWRERLVARLRAPLALLALLALSWFLVSAVQAGGLVALRAPPEQPTPAPPCGSRDRRPRRRPPSSRRRSTPTSRPRSCRSARRPPAASRAAARV